MKNKPLDSVLEVAKRIISGQQDTVAVPNNEAYKFDPNDPLGMRKKNDELAKQRLAKGVPTKSGTGIKKVKDGVTTHTRTKFASDEPTERKKYGTSQKRVRKIKESVGKTAGDHSYYYLQRAKQLAQKAGHNYDNLPQYDRTHNNHKDYFDKKAKNESVEIREKYECPECKGTGMIKGMKCNHCKGTGYHMNKEELKGNQHKIDANKNGKIDAEDFKMLRKKKNESVEYVTEKKSYDDKHQSQTDIHHKGQKIGYVVHDKKSGIHTAYHDKEGSDYNQSDEFKSHAKAVKMIKASAGVKESFIEKLKSLKENNLKFVADIFNEDSDSEQFKKELETAQKVASTKKTKEQEANTAKGFVQAVKNVDDIKEETLDEATPTRKQVKQAIGIARDKRYAGGNMTGAVKTMDKINKGLAQHPKVADELRKQNEETEQLDEVSRKHFQQVADLIKGHDSQDKRNELAKHHAGIFAKQNPRFNHKIFYKAAGANIMHKEEVEQLDELSPKTLGSYIKKAHRSAADDAFDHGDSEYRQARHYHKMPADDGEGEETAMRDTERRIQNRKKGINRASNKLVKKATNEEVNERKMTDDEKDKAEDIVKGMKKSLKGFKDRYGADAKKVMYATANKNAMKGDTDEEN